MSMGFLPTQNFCLKTSRPRFYLPKCSFFRDAALNYAALNYAVTQLWAMCAQRGEVKDPAQFVHSTIIAKKHFFHLRRGRHSGYPSISPVLRGKK